MDLLRAKNYLFKLLIMEVIIVACAVIFWFFVGQQARHFGSCLLITGAIFTGLGTLFSFSAHNSTLDHYNRVAWTGTSMSHSESLDRARKDIAASYFQSSLFLWPGLITMALGYFLYKLYQST